MSTESALSPDQLLALVRTGTELAAEIDLPTLLRQILKQAAALMDSLDGSVLLYNPERMYEGSQGCFYFVEAQGENREYLLKRYGEHSEEQVRRESITGRVFFSKTGEIVRSVQEDPGQDKQVDAATGRETQSMVCVPLAAAGEGLGVIQILNRRSGEYTELDEVLLNHFASQAAVAIRNARLFRDLLSHMGLYKSGSPNETATDLLAQFNQPAQKEELSLMFADMRGFSRLCELLGPEKLQMLLNEFLTMLCEEVLRAGGVVNKFLGDGLLAFFMQKHYPDDYVERSVQCAFAITDRFDSLKTEWKVNRRINQNIDFLNVGIGIVTDQTVVGTIGSASVRDFTAIGTPVNLGNSLEDAARDGMRILADANTFQATKHLIADFEGPTRHVLRKPGQEKGDEYDRYHLKQLTGATKDAPLIFISHSTKDWEWVESELVNPLKQLGLRPWYSPRDIKPSDSWTAKIGEGLSSSEWIVVVVSTNSVESQAVHDEVETALADDKLKTRLVLVRIDESRPEAINKLLNKYQYIDSRLEADVAGKVHATVTSR